MFSRTFAFALPDGGFQFFAEFDPCLMTVSGAAAPTLAPDFDAGGLMSEPDAGGDLVDVLSTRASGTDELLFEIGFPHPEGGHSRCQLTLVFLGHG